MAGRGSIATYLNMDKKDAGTSSDFVISISEPLCASNSSEQSPPGLSFSEPFSSLSVELSERDKIIMIITIIEGDG